MNSVLKIYRSALTPARNALVENIEYYLSKEAELFHQEDNFQYQRLNLDLDIVVKIPQEELSSQHVGNYASITQDGKTWYYFVISYEWKSTQSLQLKLSIDSVNTFQNEFTFSDKTTVERQHMDRWMINEDTGKCVRIIDEQNEELDVVKYKEEDEKIFQTSDELDWFLIYKTQTEDLTQLSNPISCYCCADKPIVIDREGGGAATVITSSELPNGVYNCVLKADNLLGKISLYTKTGGGSNSYGTRQLTINQNYMILIPVFTGTPYGSYISHYDRKIYRCDAFRFVNLNGTLELTVYGTLVESLSRQEASYWNDEGYLAINENGNATLTNGEFTIESLNFTRTTTDGEIPIIYVQSLVTNKTYYNIGSGAVRTTIPFSEIDKTDSRIVKLIRIPYAPCYIEYNTNSQIYEFPPE